MLSSFNVIKEQKVISQGAKPIVTQFVPSQYVVNKDEYGREVVDVQRQDVMAASLIEDARVQCKYILEEAMEKAQSIQKDAYVKGHEEGFCDGQQKGYNEGYEAAMVQASQEAEIIIKKAQDMLNAAKKEYENYINEKRNDILNLSINIANHILKREIQRPEGIDEMLMEVMKDCKNSESIIIRVSSLYIDNIKLKMREWKERYAIKGEIFIIADELVSSGCAVIEKSNGIIQVDIDGALENIRNSIQ